MTTAHNVSFSANHSTVTTVTSRKLHYQQMMQLGCQVLFSAYYLQQHGAFPGDFPHIKCKSRSEAQVMYILVLDIQLHFHQYFVNYNGMYGQTYIISYMHVAMETP